MNRCARWWRPATSSRLARFTSVPLPSAWLQWVAVRQTALALIGLALIGGASTPAQAAGQTAQRTIWDGVYTKEQATRGQETYNKRCGFCHGRDLNGGDAGLEVAPALAGPTFPVRWRGPLAELFLTIADEMPKNDPGSLADDTVADVVSFLLQANQAASGDISLPADPDALDAIAVTKKP
jgi:mono/diheme cytochrome c family protein